MQPTDHPAPVRCPTIIQGGMGAGVSSWKLANAVSRTGQLGVVSGTALDLIVARRLQDGDRDGAMRRALDAFPAPAIAARVRERYFVSGGKPARQPYRTKPAFTARSPRALQELTVVAAFAEVFLAKEGHCGPVGINLLEKIQLPNLATLYGAMLAGVDYVLMGAGIPLEIPGVLDQLARHEPVSIRLHLENAAPGDEVRVSFEPASVTHDLTPLKRPLFLAIIASATLALTLARKASGRVDGFVVEGPTAGGHNAPPRGQPRLTATGEPIYGEKDAIDLEKIRALELPFWLAGGYGSPEKLREAWAAGARGVQVGTPFAFCAESGLAPALRQRVLEHVERDASPVFTDPLASPTGFPFKVIRLPGTNSEANLYESRERICDLGYLRHAYRRPDGRLGYRCPAEPIAEYVAKGGKEADTTGRKCLCNGLMANIGLPQTRGGLLERPLLTAGDDLHRLGVLLERSGPSYTAADVVAYILGTAEDRPA